MSPSSRGDEKEEEHGSDGSSIHAISRAKVMNKIYRLCLTELTGGEEKVKIRNHFKRCKGL